MYHTFAPYDKRHAALDLFLRIGLGCRPFVKSPGKGESGSMNDQITMSTRSIYPNRPGAFSLG